MNADNDALALATALLKTECDGSKRSVSVRRWAQRVLGQRERKPWVLVPNPKGPALSASDLQWLSEWLTVHPPEAAANDEGLPDETA
jgi:hypothetical protein